MAAYHPPEGMPPLKPDYPPHERRTTPLTDAQLNMISEQTERAVRKGLRHWMRGAAVAFVIVLAGLAGAFAVSEHDRGIAQQAIIKSGSVVAVDSCNARFKDRQALRDLFVRLKIAVGQQAKQQGLSTNDPRVKFAEQFYDDQIQQLPLPDCRPDAKILTDQPYPPVRVPRPKHP